jgi:hypothetical protein
MCNKKYRNTLISLFIFTFGAVSSSTDGEAAQPKFKNILHATSIILQRTVKWNCSRSKSTEKRTFDRTGNLVENEYK